MNDNAPSCRKCGSTDWELIREDEYILPTHSLNDNVLTLDVKCFDCERPYKTTWTFLPKELRKKVQTSTGGEAE